MINTVNTSTNNNVVVVTAPGPSGPVGPQGPTGPAGTIQTNSGTIVSPFLNVNGSTIITGSLIVSGSNTFINIGPAQFTGSTDMLGNLTVLGTSSAALFSGSGANLFNIPASGITGLNLSRVATGSISASVLVGANSFILNNGGTNLFTVGNTGLGTFNNGLIVNGATTNLNNGLNVSTGNTIINSPVIQLIGSATLNGQPITTAGDLTLDKIKTGNVTASVSTGADSFTVEASGNTLFKISNTGILSGSGANLFNIPASGITGLNLSQIGSGSYTASIADDKFKVNTDSEITGSLIVTNGVSGSFSGDGSGLTNVPASGVVGLNLSQIATGTVTASVSTDSTAFTLENNGSNLFTVSNTGLAVVSSSINIGVPSDDNYTDGFFDTFTENTKLSDAIDEISAAFLDLAPAKAGTLVGTTLSKSAPTTFTGFLAAGLNATDWYVGASAYSNISLLTSTTTVTLNTPDTSTRFRAGKNSDRVAGTLIGGVTSSKALGNAALTVSSTRALTSGNGSTGTIQITDIAQYNTFWAKANARINDTLTVTGSYKYAISADNGAGTTNTYQMWYVGTSGDYPNQTVTAATPVTSSTTFNYLSGIPYLKTATFTLGITGSNLFNPVYNQNQISFASSFFSSLSTGSNTPNFNDTLLLNVTRTLTANTNSGQNSPTFTVTATKPGKSSATSGTVTLTAQKVNSYVSAQSTNTIEYFLDEARRYGDFQTTSWDNTSTLTDGNLQVQNGRLINGKVGDYTAFTATTQEYFRILTVTADRSSGTHTFTQSGFSGVSPWGSGGELEIAFVRTGDVTGAETASTIWDFGRAFGNNSGNIKGIVVDGTGLSGTFSLGTENSGVGTLILYIKYNNVTTTKVISQFTVSM
jgi:hypothetical protein